MDQFLKLIRKWGMPNTKGILLPLSKVAFGLYSFIHLAGFGKQYPQPGKAYRSAFTTTIGIFRN